MRRIQVFALISLLILLLFNLTVSAHSGRTDAAGGHYNHSTGEYHYHHGYSAHDHYDMDGDGILDCPYDFDNKTTYAASEDNSPANTSQATTSTNAFSSENNLTSEEITEESETQTPQPIEKNGIPPWILICVIGILGIVLLILKNLKNRLDGAEQDLERTKNELDCTERDLHQTKSELDSTERKLYQTKSELNHCRQNANTLKTKCSLLSQKTNEYQERYDVLLEILENAVGRHQAKQLANCSIDHPVSQETISSLVPVTLLPSYITLDANGQPILGEKTCEKPYGNYTVYICSKSNVYHLDKACVQTSNIQTAHLFQVLEQKRPCSKCGKKAKIPKHIPQWYKDLCTIQKMSREGNENQRDSRNP